MTEKKTPVSEMALKVGKCANEGKCECDLPQCLYPGSPCVAVPSASLEPMFDQELLAEMNRLHAILADPGNGNYHAEMDKFAMLCGLKWPKIAKCLSARSATGDMERLDEIERTRCYPFWNGDRWLFLVGNGSKVERRGEGKTVREAIDAAMDRTSEGT